MSNREESEIWSLLRNLGTDPDRGLSEVEAYNRLRRFGTNELERPYLLFRQIRLGVLFCLAMGIVSMVEGASLYAIGAVVMGVLLMVMASVLRKRYEKAGISVNQNPGICLGIRGGRLLQLPVCQLVPGDIVRIQAGDIVPADGRLTEAVNLLIQEKELSGSPEPIQKDALQPNDPKAPSEECKNKVFMNTEVFRGRGTFVVTETGKDTQIGRIKALTRGKRSVRANKTSE